MVDKWGAEGHMLHDGFIYAYEENRKDQCSETHSPFAVRDFLSEAEKAHAFGMSELAAEFKPAGSEIYHGPFPDAAREKF